MVSSVNGNTTLQALNALNAFRGRMGISKDTFERPDAKSVFDIESTSGVNLKDNDDMLNDFDIIDIRNYATQMGGELTDEDIKYGITYGRSVIADYIA